MIFEKFLNSESEYEKEERKWKETAQKIVEELNDRALDGLTERFFELNYKISGLIHDYAGIYFNEEEKKKAIAERDAEIQPLDIEFDKLTNEHGDDMFIYAVKKAAKFREKGLSWTHDWKWLLTKERAEKFGDSLKNELNILGVKKPLKDFYLFELEKKEEEIRRLKGEK